MSFNWAVSRFNMAMYVSISYYENSMELDCHPLLLRFIIEFIRFRESSLRIVRYDFILWYLYRISFGKDVIDRPFKAIIIGSIQESLSFGMFCLILTDKRVHSVLTTFVGKNTTLFTKLTYIREQCKN